MVVAMGRLMPGRFVDKAKVVMTLAFFMGAEYACFAEFSIGGNSLQDIGVSVKGH